LRREPLDAWAAQIAAELGPASRAGSDVCAVPAQWPAPMAVAWPCASGRR
jgi:hypothetical protein